MVLRLIIILSIILSILSFSIDTNKDFESLYQEGKKNMLLENYEKAEKIFNLLLEKNDKDPRIYYSLGLNFFYLNKYIEAEENFLKAFDLDPDIHFTEKDNFYNQLNQIREHIVYNKILKESELESYSEKIINGAFFIITSIILILLIFLFLKGYLKKSIIEKKQEVAEEIECTISNKISTIEDIFKDVDSENKDNLQEKDKTIEEIRSNFEKIKKEYAFIQLNASKNFFLKKEEILKILDELEKSLRSINQK